MYGTTDLDESVEDLPPEPSSLAGTTSKNRNTKPLHPTPTTTIYLGESPNPDAISSPTTHVRSRGRESSVSRSAGGGPEDRSDFENSCVIIAENSIEAHRIENNYKFGLKKWKSHVTSRPIGTRSEIIQDLYSDMSKIKDVRVSTVRPSNVLYTLVFGWWLCLLYGVIGLLMAISIIGIPYVRFCWNLAAYFFWPFGKFVHQVKPYRKSPHFISQKSSSSETESFANGATIYPESSGETMSLVNSYSQTPAFSCDGNGKCCDFWGRPSSWIWVILGLPPLLIVHSAVFAICWFFVISIPTAKLNGKTITKILFLSPNEMKIGDSGVNHKDGKSKKEHSEIIMYSHQSINFYYYKYTVDGVNIILANLLIFVVVAIVIGYAADIQGYIKCIMGIFAIIPLTYYIGMAITSISAQSNFAVGAFLNATFGSAVEVILFVIMLNKGKHSGQACYEELVKSSLTGAILCSILFIPGMSMVIGGLKFRTQKFNPKSANISASFLFLAVVGVFAPTIFSKIYGSLRCQGCETVDSQLDIDNFKNSSSGFVCQQCEQSLVGYHGDRSVYHDHIKPLVYGISIILPIAYIIGIVFTMKTHSAHLFAEFEQELQEENGANGQHGTAHWSRAKSAFILFVCAVCIALCGDLISENVQPLLEATGISEYFVGVTMLSLVAELPEVVNGVQFALQNNVNLGIEIGCSTAIQVCLVQIPILVLANLIYDMDFILVFNDVHLWAVIFSVVIINYIFQDGKSDYFQGSIVVGIYILLMLMYFFMLTPERMKCTASPGSAVTTTTAPPLGFL